MRRWLAPCLLFALLVAAGPGGPSLREGSPRPDFLPAPTVNLLDRDAEERNREGREKWIESLHRAAPGTDWKLLERANQQEHFLARQAEEARGVRTNVWTELGSDNQAGRTHVAVLAPDGNTLYVGTSNGGVWAGNLAGTSWTPLSDDVGKGVHGLVLVPGSPQVLVTVTDGGDVHCTTDGGATWNVPTGLPEYVWGCVRLLRDLGSPRTVYLLVDGWKWYGLWDHRYHLLRSDDGGQSFAIVHSEPIDSKPDIWIDRVNPGPLYLMSNGTLLRSLDRGSTFAPVGMAVPFCKSAVLAGSEAGAPKLYAALQLGGAWTLWVSSNAGATWLSTFPITDFWETLCASIGDPNLVLLGGVNCYRSTNGGAAFTPINEWYDYYGDPQHKLHADIPGIDCFRSGVTERFFIDTDGGTYVSTDGGATVNNISRSGLRISQYYSTLTHQTNSYRVAAGSQDQGYQISMAALGAMSFDQIISGDYGHLTSARPDLSMVWSAYPGFVLLQPNADAPYGVEQVDFPPYGTHDWMPFIQADPLDASAFYFCADHLWRVHRDSPGSYSYVELPQDYASGIPDERLTAFAISPVDRNYRFAVTNSGRLWYSHDAGAAWALSGSTGPAAHYFYGTELLCSPTNRDVCYVGGSGYSGPAVYRTSDGGVTWGPMGTGLPSTLVFAMAFNRFEANLYAAADAGPYRYDTRAGRWVSILGTEAPLTTYWDVEAVPDLGVMRFATYGRGIWDFDTRNATAVEPLADAGQRAVAPRLRMSPNPSRRGSRLAFEIARSGRVTIEVFDVAGHRLAAPVDRFCVGGHHEALFDLRAQDGRRLESGVYLVRMQSPDGVAVEKLPVAR